MPAAVGTFAASVEVRTETSLEAPAADLSEVQQTVVLRILQEALALYRQLRRGELRRA